MKFIIFTYDGIGLPVAKHLLDEGNEVIVAQVQDVSEMDIDGSEKPEETKKRLKLYDGVLDKITAEEGLKMLKTEDKETFILCDFNHLWKVGEQVIKMGFKNIFCPTEKQFLLERDRKSGKEFVVKHYPHLKVAEVHEFKTVEEAEEFLEESDDIFVLKGNSEKVQTFVPKTEDIEFGKELLFDQLEEQKQALESEGFILERKITKQHEATPEAMFWNGELVMTTLDLEYKYIGSADTGIQVGCGNNLIIQIEEKSKVAQLAFPPIVYEMAKAHPGLFVWDASLLYSKKEDEYYFGEFCANRWGWDSIFAEFSMCGGVTAFFEGLMKKKNPIIDKYGVSVRVFNSDEKDNSLLLWREEYDEDIWIYDMYKKGDKHYSTGNCKDLAVFTGASDDLEDAVCFAYEVLENFVFNKMEYRPEYDFLTRDFDTAIMSRYDTYAKLMGVKKGIEEALSRKK